MFRFWIIMLFTFLCLHLQAQQYGTVEKYLVDSLDLSSISDKDRTLIDSALNVFENCDTDVCRVAAVSTIVEQSWDINIWPRYNRWLYDYVDLKLDDQTLDSVTRQNLNIAFAGAINNIGYLFNATGQVDSALYYYNRCLDFQQEIGDESGMSGTYINTGYIYLNQGQINKALDYYYESLRIEESLENSTGIARALNGIGFIQYKQGDVEQALENYNRSLTLRREVKDDYGIATSLNNIGLIFKDRKEWSKALGYFQQCLTLQEKMTDNSGIAISLANLGFVHKGMGMLSRALEQYSRSLELMESLNDQQGISSVLSSLANVYLEMGNLKSARARASRSLSIATALNYPALIRDASECLASVARRENKWQEAMGHYERYIAMRDSVFNDETVTNAIHQQYRYQYEKQAMADSIRNANIQRMQEAENDRLQALADKRRQQTYFLVTVVLLATGFIVVVLGRMKTINRQKLTIEAQNDELALQKRDLSQFAHTVSHDLKTPINGIIGLMHLVEYEHTDLDSELKEKLDLIMTSATKSGELINGILAYSEAGSKAMDTEDVDVNSLMAEVVAEMLNPNKALIRVQPNLPVIHCNLYQIKQVFSNLIGNALKYNHRPIGEGQIKVSYDLVKDLHQFKIEDNGPGIAKESHKQIFDLFSKAHYHQTMDSSGIGLATVQKLVEQNEGSIWVESEEGQGATFIFTWKG